MRTALVLLMLTVSTPAVAQHIGHAGHDEPAQEDGQPEDAQDHSQMDHGDKDRGDAPAEPPPPQQMDHAAMDHAPAAAEIPDAPPPPAAGTGPARAADTIWGADAMHPSRATLEHETGGQSYLWVQGDRVEYRTRSGEDGYLWDMQGYYGRDIDKLWIKSEGEGSFGEQVESAEVQALWSRAIAPFFDLQAGIRQDFAGPGRTHLVVGLQGLAPYLFEVDAAAFLSHKGELTARIEAEYDQRITQRLIVQPRIEANLSTQESPALGIGSGIDSIELGLRLRYKIVPEFAPYIGVEQEWKVGGSADYARAAGEDPSVTNYVIGIRFWF